MINNIKKVPVKFQEDLLYFLAFYNDFGACLGHSFYIYARLSKFILVLLYYLRSRSAI